VILGKFHVAQLKATGNIAHVQLTISKNQSSS